MNTKLPVGPPDDAIRHALNRLVCAYVDLKIPVPEELAFMEPDDRRASVRPTVKGSPATGSRRFVIPTCFSPLYSADTPTTSMRKLGPVAWQAVAQGWAEIEVPDPIDPDKLRRLHAPEYVDAFLTGRQPLASSQGWAWTPEIRDGVLAINAGQLLGAELAMKHGIAANVGQGFHHAHEYQGGGFCSFNGLALVANETPGRRVFVLDCDNHGGDGSSAFAKRLPNLFNYSICGSTFGAEPHERSVVDHVMLTGGFKPYAEALERAFKAAADFKPGIVLYQAGMDAHTDDPLGGANLTTKQIYERDLTVFRHFKAAGIPMLWVLAGGYSTLDKVVALHVGTFRAACEAWD